MTDLTTSYLGLTLRNPVIVGSSTQTSTPERVRNLESAGAGAVVLKSIFEEQIRVDVKEMYRALGADASHSEAYEYLRADLPMQLGPEKYLEQLEKIKAEVTIPVIASINCISPEQWVSFARKVERVGADALEINIYDIPNSTAISGDELEERHLDTLRTVCGEVSIPVAAKIGPFYSSLPHFVERLCGCGVAGVVLFNRFFQPDIDVEKMTLTHEINLSRSEDIRLPLRWTAILRDLVSCDLCLTTGVHTPQDAVKALLAGADALQVCSVLYESGPEGLRKIVEGLGDWMGQHGFGSISEFRGKLRESNLDDRQGFERAQYVKALISIE